MQTRGLSGFSLLCSIIMYFLQKTKKIAMNYCDSTLNDLIEN